MDPSLHEKALNVVGEDIEIEEGYASTESLVISSVPVGIVKRGFLGYLWPECSLYIAGTIL